MMTDALPRIVARGPATNKGFAGWALFDCRQDADDYMDADELSGDIKKTVDDWLEREGEVDYFFVTHMTDHRHLAIQAVKEQWHEWLLEYQLDNPDADGEYKVIGRGYDLRYTTIAIRNANVALQFKQVFQGT